MTWFEIWQADQLEQIRNMRAKLKTRPDLSRIASLNEQYYKFDLHKFQQMPHADVERQCHDLMNLRWQLLRIAFKPELAKAARLTAHATTFIL